MNIFHFWHHEQSSFSTFFFCCVQLVWHFLVASYLQGYRVSRGEFWYFWKNWAFPLKTEEHQSFWLLSERSIFTSVHSWSVHACLGETKSELALELELLLRGEWRVEWMRWRRIVRIVAFATNEVPSVACSNRPGTSVHSWMYATGTVSQRPETMCNCEGWCWRGSFVFCLRESTAIWRCVRGD